MAIYLFVPGGKRSKDDWDQVRAILEERGHQTEAITLSDPQRSSLERHIDEVCGLITKQGLQEVWLTGHSYASFVTTGAAARLPARVARLIYVDALIPQSGMSLFDFFELAGVDPASYGVPAWPPFTQPLLFDEAVIAALPKRYIHCLMSQFLEMTRDIPQYVKSRAVREHWQYLELDADHYCMLNHAPELAELLLLP